MSILQGAVKNCGNAEQLKESFYDSERFEAILKCPLKIFIKQTI